MLLRQTGFISPCPSRQRLAHACVQRAQPPATRRRAALETATTAEGEEEEEIFIDLPDAQHIILEPEFAASDAALVPELRSHYLQRFADPLLTSADRFCWDYWHVPGQYSLMRTPANAFFPEDLYDRLEDALIAYGESQLGCRGISSPWLSYYVAGHRQELHTDAPHGPWAFVLSLTDWEARRFTGGETTIMQPHVLDYWRDFDPSRGLETPQLVSLVPPLLGQLTVFDPRLPHGVRIVEGCQDPREARIVLHGWFTTPTPFFQGALGEAAATPALNSTLEALYAALGEAVPPTTGTATVRVTVGGSGVVEDLQFLTNTLMPRPQGGHSPEDVREEVLGTIIEHLMGMKLPVAGEAGGGVAGGRTVITLPFVFE